MATKKKKTSAGSKKSVPKKNIQSVPQSRPQQGTKGNASKDRSEQTAQKRKKISPSAARRRKRLIDLLMYFFVLIAVASLMIVMALTVFFEIESIVIDRQEEVPYTDAEIAAVSQVSIGENLLMAQTGKAQEEICLRLPYIESCTVRRALPSTMVIEVECVEIAGLVTTSDGQQIVVSTAGKAIAPAGDANAGENLTVLSGFTAEFSGFGVGIGVESTESLEISGTIRKAFADVGLAVESITFAQNGTVSFMYDGRINCKLGLPTDLDAKLLLIVSMLTDGSIIEHEEGVIDASIDRTAYFTPQSIIEQYMHE